MEIFWLVSFWTLCVLMVAPIPFRAFMYISGKISLPNLLILDESIASLVAFVGLVGMFGFVYEKSIINQIFWQFFTIFYIFYSVVIIFVSPKLKMISDLTSRNKQRILIILTTLITLPLPVSLWLYSFNSFPWSTI